MDRCEQALAAEPKAKDHFTHLPKRTFLLDEFKHNYAHGNTLSVVQPYFGEHFDKDVCSLCMLSITSLKSPPRLLSCSLITGMFQPLDKLRGNAFASVILFGTSSSSSISGI